MRWTSLQKRIGMAGVVKKSRSFICTPTCLSTNGKNHRKLSWHRAPQRRVNNLPRPTWRIGLSQLLPFKPSRLTAWRVHGCTQLAHMLPESAVAKYKQNNNYNDTYVGYSQHSACLSKIFCFVMFSVSWDWDTCPVDMSRKVFTSALTHNSTIHQSLTQAQYRQLRVGLYLLTCTKTVVL